LQPPFIQTPTGGIKIAQIICNTLFEAASSGIKAVKAPLPGTFGVGISEAAILNCFLQQ